MGASKKERFDYALARQRLNALFAVAEQAYRVAEQAYRESDPPEVTEDVRSGAMQYFAQGHDLSFLQVKPWLINNLGTIGHYCRSIFTTEFLQLMDSRDVPVSLKVAWNDQVQALLV